VVDGGASGCRLGVFDANGELCASAQAGPASLTLSEIQAWHHIEEGLQKLAADLGYAPGWRPARLSMGLAGSLQHARRERFLALIPPAIDSVLVTDGHAQLLGASNGQPGVCLALGTGSVVHWLDVHRQSGMAGGWGFPVGDEASGAWLGFQLLNAYVWHRDNNATDAPIAAVFKALEGKIGRSVSDIQQWTTTTCSTEYATLAPLVDAAAVDGDTVAMALLDKGAEHCMRLLSCAPANIPVFVVGGLADTYQARLSKQLGDRLCEPRGDVFSGLYVLSQSPNKDVP